MNPTPEEIIHTLRRALSTALVALDDTANYLTLQAEMNAALHQASDRVIYTPLHSTVLQATAEAHDTLAWASRHTGQPISPPPLDLPRVTKLTPPPIHADERQT